jgi:hypothetical protein
VPGYKVYNSSSAAVRLAHHDQGEEAIVILKLSDIFWSGLMLVLAGLIAGCTPHISTPAVKEYLQAPADFPEAYYRQAEMSGTKILRVDPVRSFVTAVVRRGGALARLGHDHVVTSHDVRGYVDMARGQADLYVPLERLAVDEPVLRAEAELSTQPSAEAVKGTRRNMLEKVLDSARYPYVLIHVNRSTNDTSKILVTITLHGTSQIFDIPAEFEIIQGGLKISGNMKFNQTDFGIIPFSILGGALQVQDRLDLSFRIFAEGN